MSTEREQALWRLCKQISYEFHELSILEQALEHSSWCYEQALPQPALACNQRLEFLGDAVLELVSTRYLYDRFPHLSEGELSRIRAGLVNTQKLALYARELNLGAYLRLGRGEEQQNGRDKVSILADTFEALLAAVYLDGGPQAASALLLPILERHAGAWETGGEKDHKSILQEKIQSAWVEPPQYKLLSATGPDHQKTFQVAVLVQGRTLATGSGNSKKQAEQEAARTALAQEPMLPPEPEEAG
jgi:ribonuclease-3